MEGSKTLLSSLNSNRQIKYFFEIYGQSEHAPSKRFANSDIWEVKVWVHEFSDGSKWSSSQVCKVSTEAKISINILMSYTTYIEKVTDKKEEKFSSVKRKSLRREYVACCTRNE